MNEFARFLVIAGITLVVVGLLLWSGFGRSWLGRLPGDLRIERGNFSFYLPIVSCLLISAILTLVFWLFRR
jgi:hypothetical protein